LLLLLQLLLQLLLLPHHAWQWCGGNHMCWLHVLWLDSHPQ